MARGIDGRAWARPGTPQCRAEWPELERTYQCWNGRVNAAVQRADRSWGGRTGDVVRSRGMIFAVLNQFQDNPAALVAFLAAAGVAMVTGLAFHEFCHAWSAYQLGDDLAARQGRLTLNPLKHLDPIGSALLLLVGFGFAKPTPVNPMRLRYGPIKGGAIVSAAGPLSNFFIAAVAALPLKAGLIDSVASFDAIGDASGSEIVGLFLVFLVFWNVLLGVFNMIPIPPLDGFDVIQPLLPRELRLQLQQVRPWGPALLIGLIVISFATGGAIDPLGWVIGGLSDFVFDLIG